MRIAVTGGGTGGHVYPALEVAKLARERGAELLYLGSLRGQEGDACRKLAIPFEGFRSEPLYSLATVRGWRAMASLLGAVRLAKRALLAARPDAVFSTGGYSAAPVMAAARILGIPYAIHDTNSVPGRSNRIFAASAAAFTCTFQSTSRVFSRAVRTGQPIRRELREAVSTRREGAPTVIVLGGSQGSAFLNQNLPAAADLLDGSVRFVHATGRGNFESLNNSLRLRKNYRLVPYLDTSELVEAYVSSTLAVARSGGTVAEFAMFGLPSVLVPLPTSADDHQLANAREFVELGGATLLEQKDATPEALAAAIEGWLGDGPRRARASEALRNWDVPDATERIVDILFKVAGG